MASFTKALAIHNLHFSSQKILFSLIIAAVILRLFLALVSIHPDFFFIFMFPNLVSHERLFSVYPLFENELAHRQGFYYTPAVLYFFSIFTYIGNFIDSDISRILNHAFNVYKSGNINPLLYLAATNMNYPLTFLVLKLPYIIFDAGTLILLLKLVKNSLSRRKIFLFWLINPVLLYGTYMYGQFDVIPAFLLMLGVYFAITGKKYYSLLFIGLAATFKNFALVCILPTALIIGKNKKEVLTLLLIGFTPFFLCLIVVYLQAKSQVLYTVIPKFYIAKSNINSAYALFSKVSRYSLLAISYIFVLILSAKLNVDRVQKIIFLDLASLLLLFAFSPIILFHYINIVIPLLVLGFQNSKYLYRILISYIVLVAIFKLWTPLQQWGLFAPIDNKFLTDVPSTAQVINWFFPYSFLSSIAYVVFFFFSLALIIYLFYKLLFTLKIR